ncbi:MAG: TRAP transporter large permease subunit [Nitrososphaerota archaeon]
MTPEVVGGLGFCLLFMLLLIGVPIGVAMGVSGLVGLFLLLPPKAVIAKLALGPFDFVCSFTFATLPLFFLMGQVIFTTGQGRMFYVVARKWFGRVAGGLAMATIVASAGFGALTASSIACAVTIGQIAYEEMRRYGYNKAFALGSIAAGGTLGSLIPPSGFLIIYGIITENSIGKLFVGAILPGIICTIAYVIVAAIVTGFRPGWGPGAAPVRLREKFVALQEIWELICLIIFCMGGLLYGLFTSTEAGAIGALGAFVSAALRKKLSWSVIKESLSETLKNTGMIFSVLIGATVFNVFCAASNLPEHLALWVANLDLSALEIMLIIVLIYIILGALMDEASIQLITLPIFYPIVIKLGFDPIWFGVMQARLLQIGMIIPPIAIIDFILAGMFKEKLSVVYRGVIPFLIMDMFVLLLFTLYPEIVLWLPSKMK